LKKEEIKKMFEVFASKKIMVIGDVMIDSYLWGKVDRISPEAPVPVVNCSKHESRLGGAGNVALNLVALGASPLLCGIVGNDDNGTLFFKLMQNNRLTNNGIYITKNRPTTIKTRVIGGNQQLIRIDEETDKPLEGKNESGFIEHLKKLISKESIDAIIFQDYDKGALTPNIINEIIILAKQKNIPTLVDPKKRNFMSYENVNLFKPNFKELCDGLKIDLVKDNFSNIFESTAKFQKQKKIELLLITLSEKGIFVSDDKKYFHIPAHVRDITDVSGAGDTVISTACLCLTAGLHPRLMAAISNLAGGLVCEKVGVVPIDKNKLEEEMLQLDFS
jgi:D-glycero-beta-D-manno-heptose-7-phosphate kinase